jgi:DNA anti-recombination protein RmuC
VASDPQIELRVSRLENDSNSIYDLITEIKSTQQEHSQRLGTIETTLTARFDQMETRFDQMETSTTARLDQMETSTTVRLDQMETSTTARFDQMETSTTARFDQMETSTAARFDQIETTLTEIVRRLPDLP